MKPREGRETLEGNGRSVEEDSSESLSSAVKGRDLKFLTTKKPARVAERNIRISLNGHIFFFFPEAIKTHFRNAFHLTF